MRSIAKGLQTTFLCIFNKQSGSRLENEAPSEIAKIDEILAVSPFGQVETSCKTFLSLDAQWANYGDFLFLATVQSKVKAGVLQSKGVVKYTPPKFKF